MEDLDFSNFTEVDINFLGTFLRGLAQEELKKLPEAILLTAIRRLGEQTGLPEDKLKARAFLAVELFKVRLQSGFQLSVVKKKLITSTNYSRCKQRNESIQIQSNSM